MPVCAVRVHVSRIAQGRPCGAGTPLGCAQDRLCPRACARNCSARVKVAQTLPVALCFFPHRIAAIRRTK
jgi:hypothetical protein